MTDAPAKPAVSPSAAGPGNAAGAEGQTLDGRYRLDALLDTEPGRTLWRATDLQNQQTVAVQLWSAETSPNDGTMTAGRLRQPEGVHPVFVGMEWNGRTPEGQAYAVHASLAGRYLDSWLESHALTAIEALELSAELTASLTALHKSGQVHGALESNVLIVTDLDGDAPALRIVDAGIDSQPAVPHGSAVKAELAKVGKLFERLADLVKQVGGADATQAMQGLATLGKRAQAAPDLTPFDSMQQLDDAVQVLATTTPGKRARNGARKVVSTMDFSEAGSGVRAAVAPVFGGAAQTRRDALAETLEQVAVPAESDDFMAGLSDEPPKPTGVDVTDAMSSLLIPASNMPAMPSDDGQMLPEIELANAAPRPVAATMPREPKGKKGQKTKDHSSQAAPPPAAAPPAPPTTLPSVKPQPSGGGGGDGKGAAIAVAVLLAAAIAVIVFVLLPGPDRPATPMQAILVSAADVQTAPEITPEPEVMAEPDTAAAVDTAPEPDTAAAIDTAPEVDTAAAVDTAPEIDTEPAKDTEPLDTAVPETVAPETVAPETVAPETVAAVPETVAPEIVAVETIAAPETTAPPEGDEFPGIEPPLLPGEKEFRSIDQLAASLRATETIIKRARSDGKGAGVTAGLLAKLQANFKDGDVIKLRMRTIYYVAMQTLNKGGSEAAASTAVVARYDAGKL